MTQKMNTSFTHIYECRQLSESPASAQSPHYYYPGASTEGGRDGIVAEVRPENGGPWLGTFAFGQITPRGVSGIFTTPDPQRFCVVAKGQGYLVYAKVPTEWESVRATPIIDVRLIPAQGIIVF